MAETVVKCPQCNGQCSVQGKQCSACRGKGSIHVTTGGGIIQK